jgi:hypothetical protein
MTGTTNRGLAKFRRQLEHHVAIERMLPTSNLRYEYGFGFGHLYHPYFEVLKTPSLREGADLMGDFYDAMGQWREGLNDWQALPVQAWRFGKSQRTTRLVGRIPSVHFGSVPDEGPHQAQKRVEHLFRLRDSIDKTGYNNDHPHPIDGVWVGETFLVLGGQHRVAVLASLGWEKIPVKNLGRKNTPKKLVAKKLPLVTAGHLALEDATQILSRIETGFNLTQAKESGFPFASADSVRPSDA